MIEATGTCAGIENYSRFCLVEKGEPPPTLFEYFPDNTIGFVDESHVTVPQLNGMYKGDHTRKKLYLSMGLDCLLVWTIDPLNLKNGML